jgi:DNA-binding IclR family transcriptional regulator
MARPALSATRALDVLNFLAAQPDRCFTLSELVRQVGINVASMHALLAALEAREYVSRDEGKAYGLGPMLVSVGHAALRRHQDMDKARGILESLTAELGLTGLLVGATGAEMLVIYEVRPGHRAVPTTGQRIRMLAPIGGVFYARADEETIATWIRSAPKAVRDAEDDLRRWLAAVRARGYAVGLETAARKELRRAVRELDEEPGSRSARSRLRDNVARLGDLATVVIEPDPHEPYRVAHIATALRASSAGTSLALYLLGFRRALTAFELEHIGERLRDAASGIVAATGLLDTADRTGTTEDALTTIW